VAGSFAPGKDEGQDYIDYNISGSSATKKSWIVYPAAQAKIKVARPVTTGGNH